MVKKILSEFESTEDIIDTIRNMNNVAEEYKKIEAKNNKEIEDKKKELDNILEKRENTLKQKRQKELDDLNERTSDQKYEYITEQNKYNSILLDTEKNINPEIKNKIKQNNTKNSKNQIKNVESKKYPIKDIQELAKKINNNKFFTKIKKKLKKDGYDSNINMLLELNQKVQSSCKEIQTHIDQIEENHKQKCKEIQSEYDKLKSSIQITKQEKDNNNIQIEKMKKDFEIKKNNIINNLNIEKNISAISKELENYYINELVFKDFEEAKQEQDKICIATEIENIDKNILLEELQKIKKEQIAIYFNKRSSNTNF